MNRKFLHFSLLILLIVFLLSFKTNSQTLDLITSNVVVITPYTFTFDLYMKNTWSNPFQTAASTYTITYTNGILNGGTGTATIDTTGIGTSFFGAPIVFTGYIKFTGALIVVGGPTIASGDSILVFRARVTSTNLLNLGITNYFGSKPSPPNATQINRWNGTSGVPVSNLNVTFHDWWNRQLPVQIASFTSNISGRDVKLNWTTATEINNAGFEVQKSEVKSQKAGEWVNIGYVNGNGTKNTPTNYAFEDKKLNSGKYKYRLKQVDYNGNFEYYNLENAVEVGVPNKFDLSQNYPNPFNPTTKIDFELPYDSKVSLKLYDMSGREVLTLVNGQKPAGYYTVQMNIGNLSSGTYFYRIFAEGSGQNFVMTKKMMLIK